MYYDNHAVCAGLCDVKYESLLQENKLFSVKETLVTFGDHSKFCTRTKVYTYMSFDTWSVHRPDSSRKIFLRVKLIKLVMNKIHLFLILTHKNTFCKILFKL